MSSEVSTATSTASPTEGPPPAGRIGTTLFKVAWMSILLGLSLEVVLLVLAAASDQVSSLKPFVADLVQKVSWSSLVCGGLSLGTAASRIRPAVMGLLGLLSAPLAFGVARSLHKSAQQVLAIAGGAAAGPSPWTLAAIKAVEYAFFGVLIAWVAGKPRAGVRSYLGVGLLTGVLFGGLILALIVRAAPAPLPISALVPRIINELLFPLGCALVLFAANSLSQRAK